MNGGGEISELWVTTASSAVLLPALGGCGDLRQRGALRAVLACHGIARKDDLTLIKAQQPRADLTDLLLELLGALLNRLAGDIGRAGCVGAGIVGRGIGVRAEDRHIVERAVQHLGGDLRQIVSQPVPMSAAPIERV